MGVGNRWGKKLDHKLQVVIKEIMKDASGDDFSGQDTKVEPLGKWPGMVVGEIRAIPKVLRAMDLRFIATIVIASLCGVLAKMVGDLARKREVVLWLWGPEASERMEFFVRVHWAGFYILGYVVVPMLAVGLILREPLSDFGLSFGKLRKHLPIYFFFICLAAPMVAIASQTQVFLAKYPKMPAATLSEFFILELLYVLQFVGVEFFYRGFLLFPSVRKFGLPGIMLPIVPYCMLHFAKPIPEAIGAIFAGMLLGYYAWKSRSIWGGVLLHGLVAVTMDTLAIITKRGSFF